MVSDYQNLLKKLYSLSRFQTEKVGLRNILKLNSYLNDPVSKLPIVHVAGTNGKVRERDEDWRREDVKKMI
jgi:folylpolyglutamate synthase/dihydropteroate synthase